jgi:acetolactate synthase-1/2/3 large subunit
MSRVTGGEILKRCLLAERVRYVFGVPGDQLYPVLDAIKKDERIDFITTHHEASAAHMADAWARLTGEIGVCMATVGPGAANIVGGVYPAYAEGIPLLIITAQNQTWRIYPDHGSMQALDQIGLFKSVTKWNAVVSHWTRIPEMVQQAFRAAISGKPGPVHLDFPSDVLHKREEESEVKILPPERYRPVRPPAGNLELIEKAAEILAEAERPLIRAGGGVLRAKAFSEILELAEYLEAPITTSVGGKGSVPEDHHLYLLSGSLGTGGLAAQGDADVILLIGCMLGDLDMWGKPPAWGEEQKFIQIDICPQMIGLNREVEIGIVGDAKETLRLLIEKLRKYSPKRSFGVEEYRELDRIWAENYRQMSESDDVPIHPLRLIKEVRDFFPRDAITVVDGGNTAVWCHYLNRIYEPGTYLSCVSGNSGHLGAGIPYALAAKLAFPDRQVYCITGDGAFSLNIQELETAYRFNLPVIFIVANDRAWGMIRAGQTLYYGKRYIGVDFEDVRYDLVAKAMNCYGERVVEPSEIKPALERAVNSGLPAVIDVEIGREAIPPDFEILAAIWLDGCEPPEKEEVKVSV